MAKHYSQSDTRRTNHSQRELQSEELGSHARMDLFACSTWHSKADSASAAATPPVAEAAVSSTALSNAASRMDIKDAQAQRDPGIEQLGGMRTSQLADKYIVKRNKIRNQCTLLKNQGEEGFITRRAQGCSHAGCRLGQEQRSSPSNTSHIKTLYCSPENC